MSRIVVLGAGLGGVIMAYEMKDKMRPEDELTVVNLGSTYSFVPSNPWVAVGWRKREDISVDLDAILAKRGIGLRPEGARRVRPEENRIELNDGSLLDYDYLIIATGPDLAFDEIEGLGPDGNTQSICHIDHAETDEERLRRAGQEARPDRGRRGAGRLLLRPGLRVRLHPRHRAPPAPGSATGCR